jgi:hypothetical protein
VIRGIRLLRLHALLAGAHGDEVRYRQYRVATATWGERLVSGAYCVGRGHAMTPGIAGGAAHIVLKQTTDESLESTSRNDAAANIFGMLQPDLLDANESTWAFA